MQNREENRIFKKEGFLLYLSGIREDENGECRKLLEGIVRFGMLHHSGEKDELCWFLSDVIPDLTFGEAAMFAEDEILSPYGRLKKRNAERGQSNNRYAGEG